MLKGIRSWRIWSILFGLLQFLGPESLSASWGIVLVLVGLGSFIFKAGSMYAVYAVVMAWAAIGNLLSLEWVWIGIALLQAWWTYRLFRDFYRYRNAGLVGVREMQSPGELTPHDRRAERVFPWASLSLGALSFLTFICIFAGMFAFALISAPAAQMPSDALIAFLVGLSADISVLAIAFGIASLLARYRLRGLALVGMATGFLVIAIILVISLLPMGSSNPNLLTGL